ncbi:MAG: DNA gyrase inhibitor YacG [Methylibium sp.]|uniref:DNA gyrase inhibitor YacG n=1 Tax=Methylibium sp. TaxID=2067992 RepID=UPI0017EBA7BE|nr:DNA gyrase inhibitor YacG [Methylibium sp.]MBA2723316.1 DNA gyrase inhibitor YacG [Methylibium sp.]MBA3598927.1 DNA gyrase inhibitor YacG [Methylibium sp.]
MRVSRRQVRCPGCGQHSEYSPTNAFRPFCSERCKNADFGAWASERYRVETAPPIEDEESPASPPLQPPH